MEKNKNEIKIYLNNENKSGYKSKKVHIKKTFPELYKDITEYSIKYNLLNISFLELLFLYLNNLTEPPVCPKCGEKLTFKRSFSEGYGKYCSIKCTNSSDDHIEKVKSTNIIKYGGNSPNQSKKIRDKIKKTNITLYGVDNLFKDTDRIKNNVLKKYNVSHISKLESTKEKKKRTNIKKYGVSTPILLDSSRRLLTENLNNKFVDKYSHLNIVSVDHDDISIKCNICEKNYIINRHVLYHRNLLTKNPCTFCYPIKNGTSISETDIADFIEDLGLKFEKNNRTILNGQELDIYIPSHNIAIEYDGLYWHSEKYCEDNYHFNKTNDCEKNGIQLIHIFEDEWKYKKEIVKSRIRHILGFSTFKIFARKCEIREINSSDYRKFVEKNHIQGNVNSSVKIGLFYQNELVSVMSFGKLRISLGSSSKDNQYEMLRFCNKLNTSVVGGSNKLFKWFIKNYNPKTVISYCDRRWSNGKIYKILGFNLEKITTPNYFYVVNDKRENRFKYRKDQLVKNGFDPNLTEKQIMLNRKIFRIYDSGSFLFKFDNP